MHEQKLETAKTALERKEAELNRQLSQFRVEIIELQEQNVSAPQQLAHLCLANVVVLLF